MNQSRKKILVVDDDNSICNYLEKKLIEKDFDVTSAYNGSSAIELCQENRYDIIILDYEMPGINGIQVIAQLKKLKIEIPIIMLTAHDYMDVAVEAISKGAKDFITKPFNLDNLFSVLEKYTRDEQVIVKDIRDHHQTVDPQYRMIGSSNQMMDVYKFIGRVSQSDNNTSILITGESGVGKELVARQIHFWGNTRNQPFVGINLNALPDTLVESELFGYSKGAFTSASETRIGKLEYSADGTILLDEIGDISLNIQTKLLRVFQEREYYPVGSNKVKNITSRIVATTNADLKQKVNNNEFRKDFYYRLRTVWINIPPLRKRANDIPLLINFFIRKYAGSDVDDNPIRITERALKYFQNYDWPGNVRELENTIRSAITTQKKQILDLDDFNFIEQDEKHEAEDFRNLTLQEARRIYINRFEKDYIKNSLMEAGGRVSLASKRAGINRQNFYKLMRKHNLKTSDL